jgi:hypothetical protein
MVILVIVICFQHSKWMPINVWPPEVIQDHSSPSLCTIIKHKATELLGNVVCYANQPRLVAVLAGHLCEFHTEQWGEPCSVPVGCLPHPFLQLIVCKSASYCLKSLRVALLLQDRQREGAFACTHAFVPCLYLSDSVSVLAWHLCVNFIPNSEGSLALFLLVVCPTLFCNW